MLNSIDILKREVELQASAMYARGENPTCWRIAESLGKKDPKFFYIEPLLKLWKEKHPDVEQRNQVYWRPQSKAAALRRLNQSSLLG